MNKGSEMLQKRMQQLRTNIKDMSEDLKKLLAKDIEEQQKREKRRSSEILSIFAAHNYYADGFTPVELRTTLEDLGPTFVKIGQIMSSRVDILPASYCKELEKLRENVKELEPKIVRAVIEQETGKKIDEIYSEFSDKPLGSASIGQVHYGVLKDGTRVVTKVQRPLIADMMIMDFELLRKLADMVNVMTEDSAGQVVDFATTIEEFEKVTYEELSFLVEAENTRFFKENCIEDEEKISCPTVIDALSTERIFTMTFVEGYAISKRNQIIEAGYDVNEIGKTLIDNYAHQVLDVGVFHADPHQGNIIISGGKPCWIDFGMIGRLTEKDIELISDLVVSLLKLDIDKFVTTVSSLGAVSADTNMDRFHDDAELMLSKYAEVTSVDEMNMPVLFEEVMDIVNNNHIELPGRFTMLIRSVATIEGVIEEFCPGLNLIDILSAKLMERAKSGFDIKTMAANIARHFWEVEKNTIRLPALVADSLSTLNRGRMKVNMEVTGIEEPLRMIGEFLKYAILAVFACVLFIGSCILCMTELRPVVAGGVPLVALAGILFSIALAIFSVKKLWMIK